MQNTTYLEQRRIKKLSDKPEVKKGIKPIARFSKKRAAEQREYVKLVKEYAAISDRCELKVKGICTGAMEGLHHQKKRGINLLDRRYLKRACNACNGFCETHPLEAIRLGLSLSKLSK